MNDEPRVSLEPSILPGFESRILEFLSSLITKMPAGAAELKISRVPGQPDWPEPYFEVRPTKPNAGPFSGIIRDGDGIDLTVGARGTRELRYEGGNFVNGLSCEEEFAEICRVVTIEGFVEEVVHDEHGGLVYAEATVLAFGKEITFGSGRWLPLPFLTWDKRRVQHSPYF